MQSGGADGPSVANRVVVVLESCGDSGHALSLVDLVERTGLPKATLHRICWKLVELGMLEHEGAGFRIGAKLFALGSMHPDLRRLRAAAMPHLHDLAVRTHWATNLAVLAGGRALIVEEVYAGPAQPMDRAVGSRLPLHSTAVGKALLSGCSDAAREELLGPGLLRPYTRSTIVRVNLLRDHLATVQRTGVAYSHEECAIGTSGVAAPVVMRHEVIAAVAAIGPPGEAAVRQRAGAVRVAAAAISRALDAAGSVGSAAG